MSASNDYQEAMEYGARQYADVLALLAEAGYRVNFTQTGGMCAAIELALDGGRFALVTDEDGPLAWERDEHRGWAVGVYEEVDTSDAVTLDTVADSSPSALLKMLASIQ